MLIWESPQWEHTDQALLLHPRWLEVSLLLPWAHGRPLAPIPKDDGKVW